MRKLVYLFFVLFAFASCSKEVIVNQEVKPVDTGVNPDEWVLVPAGHFYYNMHAHDAVIDNDYEIMVTDVTNKQYAEFMNKAVAAKAIKIDGDSIKGHYPGDPFDGYLHEWKIPEGDYVLMPFGEPGSHIKLVDGKFVVDKGFENHPVVMVTWFGAKAYADFYGYRLPTEKEWAKAARGTDKRAYPWGDEISVAVTNFKSSHNAIQKMLDAKIGRTTPVGYYNGKKYGDFQTEDNRSPYGLYDMGGNVWQWVGDDYPDVHYRYMRGGSFDNYEYNLFVWARNSAGPDYYGINVGFRCARDVKTETVTEVAVDSVSADTLKVEEIEVKVEEIEK
ncbi:MAG: formylglycine-generating enzyme family protein [Chlorobi bacterium]|nr:formylglycine-generating enzyme family protein [Chlorobiota bacterium]